MRDFSNFKFMSFTAKFKSLVLATGLGFMTLTMNGCDPIPWVSENPEQVHIPGEVRVLTLNNPLIYSTDKTGEISGVDHDLLESFAETYHVKLKFIPLRNASEIRNALEAGQGDIAAARLPTPDQNPGFLLSPPYEETKLGLYCHKKAQVQNIRDLNGKIVAVLDKEDNGDLELRLKQFVPDVHLIQTSEPNTQNLFRQVSDKSIDCLMAESLEGQYYVRYFPNVEKVTVLTGNYTLNWWIRPTNPELAHLLESWFRKARSEDELVRVEDRYRRSLAELSPLEILNFIKMAHLILPDFEKDFKQAAQRQSLPWQLIAAVSYQESHWNRKARSYTGVRGLMQLTRETADRFGVEDRTDPLQSISGGAKYLHYLLKKTPSFLNAKDRLSLALAAYNMGDAHLRDAQKLAAQTGLNPYSWHHLRQVIPLLENPAYASSLEYGPARGHETVTFVERVRSFYNLMVSDEDSNHVTARNDD